MNEHTPFEYDYSAVEQNEIKQIREKYLPHEETALERLRRYDKQVTQKATLIAIIIGVIGTLIMGIGLTLCLEFTTDYFIPGIIVGVTGMVILAVAFPIYQLIYKKEKEKIAPLILQLTEELLK